MFSTNYIRSVFGYHFWANEQIFKKSSNLHESEYLENLEIGHGSIHATLFHIIKIEKVWLSLIMFGKLAQDIPSIDNYPNLNAIQLESKKIETGYLKYLDQAKEIEFSAVIQVADKNGVVTPFQRWRMLQHVVSHGAQHRAEAAIMLTHLGQSPGDLDFISY